jgi:hypothetical protein
MKSFYNKEDYTIDDIYSLITNQVEESIYLEFKEAGALDKGDRKRIDISKDISSFANSDGGIIIYGLKEVEHKASEVSFINGNEFTKEWLEQVINSSIQRHIEGLKIYPIRENGNINKTMYIVKIPYSYHAPHLSKDNRYYKRYNFMSVPMEEYEVRQAYSRKAKTKLKVDGVKMGWFEIKDDDIKIGLEADIYNCGDIPELTYKINFGFLNMNKPIQFEWSKYDTNIGYTRSSKENMVIYANGMTTIFPKELLTAIRFEMNLKISEIHEYLDSLSAEIKLFYSGGEEVYINDLVKLKEVILKEVERNRKSLQSENV